MMQGRRGCGGVVLMRHTFAMVLGAGGGRGRGMLIAGQAMERHQHCRQPLQGQGQQQH